VSNGSPPPNEQQSPEPGPPARSRRVGLPVLVTLGVLVPASVAQPGGGTAGKGAPTLVPLPEQSEDTDDDPKGGASGDGSDPGDGTQTGVHGKPLAGKTVVIDPGHNPNNREHAAEINQYVDIGTGRKPCDTTGTATESGYSEAEFTLDLARRVRAELRERGATVELTHQGSRPWGPCVDDRAKAGNEGDADAAVSLHADGAPAGARGFHVILPDSVNEGEADTRAIAGPSRTLGRQLAKSFRESTDARPASYAGDGEGTDTRADLGGLNLTRVPKVFLECGNMRNAKDAALLTDRKWRGRAAHGVVEGITAYLTARS
jgi:N-acetylmuramoyl-L-alanine amidase